MASPQESPQDYEHSSISPAFIWVTGILLALALLVGIWAALQPPPQRAPLAPAPSSASPSKSVAPESNESQGEGPRVYRGGGFLAPLPGN